MYPIDLEHSIIPKPKHSNNKIIIMTGDRPRHIRFALKIQKHFPSLVSAWYEYDTNKKESIEEIIKKDNKWTINNYPLIKTIINIKNIKDLKSKILRYNEHIILKAYKKEFNLFEEKLFENEINSLEKHQVVKKKKINTSKLKNINFIKTLKSYDAYFLLTLGGPLLKKEILNSINGLAINQHAGHSPTYKGNKTIEWAIYHRNYDHISNTVHLTTSGADSGPILRRSNITIHPDDSIQMLFLKSVALGTELMIETIGDIIKNDYIVQFIQPKEIGNTFIKKDFTSKHQLSIIKDFKDKKRKNLIYKSW